MRRTRWLPLVLVLLPALLQGGGELAPSFVPSEVAARRQSVEQERQLFLAAYAFDRAGPPPAERWWGLRWEALAASSEKVEVLAWIGRMKAEGLGLKVDVPEDEFAPLDRWLSPSLLRWIAEHPEFVADFFAGVQPLDDLPRVFQVLNRIWLAEPGRFARWPRLALAMSLVHDVPPPKWWPHSQVGEDLLPRRLPDPVELFRHWARQAEQKRAARDWTPLSVGELALLCDPAVPMEELKEAAQGPLPDASRVEALYSSVPYDVVRLERGGYAWSGGPYRLESIRRNGGLCVDQAFYAAQVCKAWGMPSAIFFGRGRDSRHAWFGYLAAGGWKLDCGRGTDASLVVGLAIEPRSWRLVSAPELMLLIDRARDTVRAREARYHADVAAALVEVGRPEAAEVAARRAIGLDARQPEAWSARVAAATQQYGPTSRERIFTLAEAAAAFREIPDREAAFALPLIDTYAAQGQKSLAESETRRLAARYAALRPDLGVRLGARLLEAARASGQEFRIWTALRAVTAALREAPGTGVFDEILFPWVEDALRSGDAERARRILAEARAALLPAAGSQLDKDLRELEVRAGRR